jgi:putative DNA primase/helicase
MCGNHRPIVRGNEQSSWQRIDLIPFSVTIPEARQDKGLREKLRAEASGILNWLVEGCVAWRKTGLAEPAEITDATRSYRSDMDMLGDFIDECCVLEPGLQETSAALSRAFNRWRLKNGEQPMSRRSFGIELKERGFARKRVGAERVRTWTGIGLRADTTSQNATDTFF